MSKDFSQESDSLALSDPKHLLVLMTTHNNSTKLNRALTCLSKASLSSGLNAYVLLANSGKPSGISQAQMPMVTIDEFSTTEDTFWASGMRLAWEKAQLEKVPFELVLWLNDDTFLDQDSLCRLLKSFFYQETPKIIVGATRNISGQLSYGGMNRRSLLMPLHFVKLGESQIDQQCDTFNGNVVLVPRTIVSQLGGFPAGYTHLRADLDYGLSARATGRRSIVVAGTVGVCDDNLNYKTYSSLKGKNLISRLSEINSPKFGPYSEHIKFSLRHGGLLGPVYALAPIVRAFIAR